MAQRTDNRLALFPNDFKEEESHPDYRGRGMVDGKKKDIAGWVETYTQDGEERKYISIAVSEPYNDGNGDGKQQGKDLFDKPNEDLDDIDDIDDDLPF